MTYDKDAGQPCPAPRRPWVAVFLTSLALTGTLGLLWLVGWKELMSVTSRPNPSVLPCDLFSLFCYSPPFLVLILKPYIGIARLPGSLSGKRCWPRSRLKMSERVWFYLVTDTGNSVLLLLYNPT